MLNTDFSNLSQKDKHLFNYISFILLAKNSIENSSQVKKVQNYLEGECVNVVELENAIKNRKIKSASEDEIYKKDYIKYSIDLNKKLNTIDFIITENIKINRKPFSNINRISYNYKIFSKEIINIINKSISLENFESKIFENILAVPEYSDVYYEKIRPIFNKIIKKILKSKETKNFFEETYKKKYEENYSKIEYHFDQDEVQEEILNRISFFPIFDGNTNAFTNPNDLTIVLNSIPGKIKNEKIPYFNKKLLHIGRLIVIAVHEIMGHYLHKYYSFITNGDIAMNTKDDNIIDTKPEGGLHAEKNFLGINSGSCLYLSKVIYFFGYNIFDDYPTSKDITINEEIVRKIIIDNPDIFDFVLEDEEEEDKEEEDEEEEEEDEEEEDEE